MKKALLYTLFFILSAGFLQAQNGVNHAVKSLKVSAGYQNNYLNDAILSPLNQQGNGMQFGITYRRTAKNILGISIAYGAGELNSNETNRFTNSYLDINIGLEYLVRIANQNESVDFHVGGAYETRAFFVEWNDLDAFSYTSTQGLAIKGMLTKRLQPKHSIQTSLGIPVAQFLGRPPYNGIDEFIIENQDSPVKIMLQGEPSSFGQYLGLDWNVTYTFQISPRLAWNIDYSLFLQKVNGLHPYKRMSMTPATGITFNL
ncbi:hypothetical protein [Cyclobacterium qasimii]|uniref:Outer membrane protein beta-barrel domain-containing protein n=2 Tax=Cyclobacterium qasimii TaxID=1350429 RepID=S7VNY9_9BACT|nr:hypothetical protein [Cyclobacterium qasimii]EPR71661.1 hypothetical protein ADICYQ_0132 [Cyclobacterium qasimii M12-11B]GEO22427.1 hypothetical protein CQA01_29610 [Cyclobacterium qasimii]